MSPAAAVPGAVRLPLLKFTPSIRYAIELPIEPSAEMYEPVFVAALSTLGAAVLVICTSPGCCVTSAVKLRWFNGRSRNCWV